MIGRVWKRLTRWSLARQFMLASFVILCAGMLIIGAWISRQIERGVINQTAGVTALYVDSFIAPRLQDLARGVELDAAHRQTLDQLLTTTPLGKRIVAFKVWSREGEILYSTTPALVGQFFPNNVGLHRALAGQVASHLSDLQDAENAEERKDWTRLVETYAPIRLEGTEHVIAASEFYQTGDDLEREIVAAQMTSWLVVGVCTVLMYLLLAGIVGHGSSTIARQQAENTQLSERVRRAAARTTALNERFLRRIGADLHDGPGQDLSFALLRLYTVADRCADCLASNRAGQPVSADFTAIRTALESSLRDLRAISEGLRLPELEALSVEETIVRAIQEHERKTGARVEFAAHYAPETTSLPVKITLYRLMQEALANAYRHAEGAGAMVRVWSEGAQIGLEVADAGPGFDPQRLAEADGHLGLAGMRERVQVLGGAFVIESAPGRGTRIRVKLPKAMSDE